MKLIITTIFGIFLLCSCNKSKVKIDANGSSSIISCIANENPDYFEKLENFERKLLHDNYIDTTSFTAYLEFVEKIKNDSIDLPNNYLKTRITPSDYQSIINCVNSHKSGKYKNYYNWFIRVLYKSFVDERIVNESSETNSIKELANVQFKDIPVELFYDQLFKYSFLTAIHDTILLSGNGINYRNRKVSPTIDKKEKVNEIDLTNIISIKITSENRILVNQTETPIDSLKPILKRFILLKKNKYIDIPGYGITKCSQAVVELVNERDVSYKAFLQVQEIILSTRDELRNDLCIEKFNTEYQQLFEMAKTNTEVREKIMYLKKVYPYRILEKEAF